MNWPLSCLVFLFFRPTLLALNLDFCGLGSDKAIIAAGRWIGGERGAWRRRKGEQNNGGDEGAHISGGESAAAKCIIAPTYFAISTMALISDSPKIGR